MKLVGEYELTEDGVRIEGQITDSHIHEVRKMLAPFKTSRIYKGDTETSGKVYHVPHPKYRTYICKHVPGICTPEREREYVRLPDSFDGEDTRCYRFGTYFLNNMGIAYEDCDGRYVISDRQTYSYVQRKLTMRFLTNSAWVWTADNNGHFDITLEGMVNRHMMTMVLANATKLAKYIDNVLVRVLDHEDKFEQSYVEAKMLNLEY